MPKAALSYFGHVVRAGGMEDDVMLGRMNGARRRGRPIDKDGWTHSWSIRAEPPSAPYETICQRQSGMERSCHGCRQESDATRRHKVTR